MRKAVITGATGFLGLTVTELLLKNGVEVTAIVRPGSKNICRLPKSKKLNTISLDMSDIRRLDQAGIPIPDAFYHFAWDGTRAGARDDPALQESNYLLSMDALKAAVSLGCGVFIGAGSQAEYGAISGRLGEDDCPVMPVTAYGKAKARFYHDGSHYATENGARFVWGRVFSLYGVNDYEGSLIMSCLEKMSRNDSIELTDCAQIWDFLYVSDAAWAFYLMGGSPNSGGMYHVASGRPRVLQKFVLEMKQISGSKSMLRFGAILCPPESATGFEPCAERLKRELGWSPQIAFRDGISGILRHMKRQDHKNEIDKRIDTDL